MVEQGLFQSLDGGSIPTSPLQCYQKNKKNSYLVTSNEDIFKNWWINIDQKKEKLIVKEISREIALPFILKYEWLGTLPVNYKYFYGTYSTSFLLSVCCFVEVNFGGKFTLWNYPAICLGRGANIFYTDKHIPSFSVNMSCKLLSKKFNYPFFIVAFSDWNAGEIGTIYQACGWIYLGHKKTKEWIDNKGKRYDINTPQVRCVTGFERRKNRELKATKEQIENEKLKMIREGFKLVDGPIRGKYAQVFGKGNNYKQMRELLIKNSKPYPKRNNL